MYSVSTFEDLENVLTFFERFSFHFTATFYNHTFVDTFIDFFRNVRIIIHLELCGSHMSATERAEEKIRGLYFILYDQVGRNIIYISALFCGTVKS